ncbi:hypothetical protein EYF80_014404 [Liparis tanakae]|uniref:Uncharacterized protein n=1 Tax=Liparis tanakae TaxID=230148 RepID=A0A4Z2IBK2_9TELE|nr:hypothetical protein EYF80_014404 [Liparis tanakae]
MPSRQYRLTLLGWLAVKYGGWESAASSPRQPDGWSPRGEEQQQEKVEEEEEEEEEGVREDGHGGWEEEEEEEEEEEMEVAGLKDEGFSFTASREGQQRSSSNSAKTLSTDRRNMLNQAGRQKTVLGTSRRYHDVLLGEGGERERGREREREEEREEEERDKWLCHLGVSVERGGPLVVNHKIKSQRSTGTPAPSGNPRRRTTAARLPVRENHGSGVGDIHHEVWGQVMVEPGAAAASPGL